MEKIIVLVRADAADDDWCAQLRTRVAGELLDTGLPGLAINVRDAPVRTSRYLFRSPFTAPDRD